MAFRACRLVVVALHLGVPSVVADLTRAEAADVLTVHNDVRAEIAWGNIKDASGKLLPSAGDMRMLVGSLID